MAECLCSHIVNVKLAVLLNEQFSLMQWKSKMVLSLEPYSSLFINYLTKVHLNCTMFITLFPHPLCLLRKTVFFSPQVVLAFIISAEIISTTRKK